MTQTFQFVKKAKTKKILTSVHIDAILKKFRRTAEIQKEYANTFISYLNNLFDFDKATVLDNIKFERNKILIKLT